MMKRLFTSPLSGILFILFCVFANSVQAADSVLKVGLYPYVPRIEQFKSVLQSEWKQVHPNVELVFDKDWKGGYEAAPSSDLDVFVFDAMFFDNFRSGGYLATLNAGEIDNLNDFVGYAIKGVQYNGKYYAIPQLGCANVLFYYKDDKATAAAKSIADLKTSLGQCRYTSQVPPDVRGLMMDMEGGTTNATYYLDIAHSMNGTYPLPLPPANKLNPDVIKDMHELLSIASYENATQSPAGDYGRGKWFSQGYGKALVGFTEHMSAMSAATRSRIAFKPLPMSGKNTSSLFYADVIGVNARTRSRSLAVELANMMASSKTMIASIGPDRSNRYPQYLMAARPSIFTDLGKKFPKYNDMYSMMQNSNPVMFKLPSNSRTWLDNVKTVIVADARANYTCGCDKKSVSYIGNNAMARGICTTTCAAYGGWNGQWTNQSPAASPGTSVCGCNSCPTL